MISTHSGRKTLDLTAIKQAEFCPPAPPREDTPYKIPQRVRDLLRAVNTRALAGFFTEPTEDPHHQALTIILSRTNSNEQAVAVFDTLTHMHKQDLTPFVLAHHTLEEKGVHYGRFIVSTELRCTLESLITTNQELAGITAREHWKALFDRARPLYPLTDAREQPTHGVAILEPTTLDANSTSRDKHPHPSRSALLPGLAANEGIRVTLFAPSGADKLLIACDGHTYLQRYPLLPSITHLNHTLFKTPCAVMLIEPAGKLSREHFLGNESYLPQWLTSIGLPWVETYMPLPPADRCVIAGASLGGLAAAQAVKNSPSAVAKAVVQSGAFWWDGEKGQREEGQVLQQWLDDPLPAGVEIFHEVGTTEGYLLGWNLAFQQILTARAVPHTHRIYEGGHDYACWRQGIVDALVYFFSDS